MPYDPFLPERIEQILSDRKAKYRQIAMIRGLVFMGDDKMCIGIVRDKKTNEDRIMAQLERELKSNTKTGKVAG